MNVNVKSVVLEVQGRLPATGRRYALSAEMELHMETGDQGYDIDEDVKRVLTDKRGDLDSLIDSWIAQRQEKADVGLQGEEIRQEVQEENTAGPQNEVATEEVQDRASDSRSQGPQILSSVSPSSADAFRPDATEKQVEYIKRLAEGVIPIEEIYGRLHKSSLEELTKNQASTIIEVLKQAKANKVAAAS